MWSLASTRHRLGTTGNRKEQRDDGISVEQGDERRTPSVCDATLRDLAHAPEPADEHLYEAHEEVYEGHEQIEDDPEYLHHEVRHVVEEARRPEDDGDEQYHRYSQQRSTHDASPPPRSPRSYSPA